MRLQSGESFKITRKKDTIGVQIFSLFAGAGGGTGAEGNEIGRVQFIIVYTRNYR